MPRTKTFDENETLHQAMDLFWLKGYRGTSMQDLVEHLGVNRASLYSTYGDKHDLFKRAFEQYRDERKGALKAFLDEQTSVREGLYSLLKMSIDKINSAHDTPGCFLANTTVELLPEDEEMRNLLNKNRRDIERLFTKFLQKGVESGEIPREKDLKAIASLLFTYYNGINVVAKMNPQKKSLLASLDAMLSILD